MRRWVCMLLCGALPFYPFAGASAAEQRAVLTIRVNTVTKQDATVTLREDDVLVQRSDLEDAGLRGFPFSGRGKPSDLISLSSLKPSLVFHVDDVALALDITVTPDHLSGTVVNFGPQQDITLSKPVRSAFLNYSISASNETGPAFAGEFGTHVGAGTFSSTFSAAANRQYNSNITNWILDSPQSDRRLTIGDVVTSTGDLGGTVSIAGFGLERYFGLNPNIVRTALPQITGNALTPSTADLYVNGVLYRHELLPPGQFNFQNLPIGQGPNNTTVVVTDAFGRQQTYSNYFYGADTLLAKGISDFSYGVGVLHSQLGEETGHGAAAAARYSAGLTDNVTGGGRFELSNSMLSGGPAFTFRLAHGVVAAEGALSRSGADTGEAGLLSYQYMDPEFSGGLSVTFQSPRYASLAMQSTQDRPLMNSQISISRQFSSRAGLTLSYYRQQDRDNGVQSVWQLAQTSQISDTLQLQVSETLTSGLGRKEFGVQTALNFIAPRGLTASLNTAESNGHTSGTVQIQRALDSQTPALGYALTISGGEGSVSGFASADYRGQYGTYIADVGGSSGQTNASLNVAGGLAFVGGRLFPTQSISDSYALVDTGGLAHVRILANNVVVGRTDANGYLLVPQLGSYMNNDITIAASDTPLDYSIEEQSQHVAPAYRSGEIIHFGINRVRPVTGSLNVLLGDSGVIPSFGILQVDTGSTTLTSDIGESGEFYFDNLSTGTYHALIRFKGGECSFQLRVPESSSRFIKLGTITCANGVRS
jgi:outer membrane usher protein